MRMEYGKVVKVYSSDEKGGQLLDISSSVSNKTYRECELLSFRGVTCLPKEGDTAILLNLKNQETVVLGVLEQIDHELKPGEILIHNGDLKGDPGSLDYNLTSKILINEDYEIEISRGETKDESFEQRASIKINKDNDLDICLKDDNGDDVSRLTQKQDGSVELTTNANASIVILPTGQINIETPVKLQITAPRVDII